MVSTRSGGQRRRTTLLRRSAHRYTMSRPPTSVKKLRRRRVCSDLPRSVGARSGRRKIWMGETYVSPETVSDNHHHGESETAILVRSGNPEFVFHDGHGEVRIATAPGDYVFVPPFVPHREENPDPSNPAVIVIARSTQEAIVVNLPALYALPDNPG